MAGVMETDEQARNRFQSELEFIQCLANPNYLNFLAQRGYLREKPFVNYLKYLLYWKEPEYAKFLKYPHCLHMLELLQYEHFRKELVNAQCAKFIDEQQLLHWQHYSRKRTRLQQALAEQQQQQPPHGNATANGERSLHHSRMLSLRVAVVGAGAAGLCAARHILSRPDVYAPPVVYELSKNVGGTWFYEERVGSYDDGIPIHSSMYRNLRTNLPKEVMMFPDFPFDPQLPSFLPHEDVHRYLQSYCEAHSITPHIKFATVVDDVSPVATETGESSSSGTRWTVTSRDGSGAETTEAFDSVFVCNGHYSDPHFPSIPGMEHFKGTVMHSHSYRHPEPFSGKSVVVLGAGNSGVDICQELARADAKVILSHGKPPLPTLSSVGVEQAPPVVRVLEDGAFQFQDDSVTEAQTLMLCTGYNFTYPFLDPAELGLEIQEQLVTPLYKFMMPPAFPSLFILGVCKIICPFPHFHCQVQYALGVLEGSVPLPSRSDMEADAQREMDRKAERGVQLRHMMRMEKDQWGYYQTLAHTGKFSPPPPVTQSLFNEVVRQRQIHPHTYRRLNYRLVSATQWEEMETQTSL